MPLDGQTSKFQPLASPRAVYNFNPGWKFAFGDTTGADQPVFNDAAWASVSLPLYENLKTTGVYVYPEAIDLKKKTTEIKVESEVVNETGDYASITLSAVVVDADGIVRD